MSWHVLVCPRHGILSDREAEDAPESYVGQSYGNPEGYGEPYLCPLPDHDRRRLRQTGDPNWLITYEECGQSLRQVEVDEVGP